MSNNTAAAPKKLSLKEKYAQMMGLADGSLSETDFADWLRQHLRLTNPEAAVIADGRRFLYDATHSSSNGEASCASCHVFGHTDQLAWDLGNPDAGFTSLPSSIKFNLAALGSRVNGTGNVGELHPLKGPMLTQTLRGLAFHGPMHWRGDRAVGVVSGVPG